jgi:hypothetical protein
VGVTGTGKSLGEAPNTTSTSRPYMAIGTTTGELLTLRHRSGILSIDGVSYIPPLAAAPVVDLGAIPQVGYYAFAAVAGGKVFLVRPDTVLGSEVTASLTDPRAVPLIDLSAPLASRTSAPLAAPAPIDLAAASGASEVAVLQVPASPGLGGALGVKSLDPICIPIVQLLLGSLAVLPFDGSGVLYDPLFTTEAGDFEARLTLSGASMEFDPEKLNLKSSGEVVTVTLEADNGRAVTINVATLTLSVDGVAGVLAPLSPPAPLLVDADLDGNVDLRVKFDRAALIALVQQAGRSSPIVRTKWLYLDGTEGEAAEQIVVFTN